MRQQTHHKGKPESRPSAGNDCVRYPPVTAVDTTFLLPCSLVALNLPITHKILSIAVLATLLGPLPKVHGRDRERRPALEPVNEWGVGWDRKWSRTTSRLQGTGPGAGPGACLFVTPGAAA